MGLDMYVKKTDDFGNKFVIMSWRKNPNINGLFEKVWRQINNKGEWHEDSLFEHPDGNFSCIPFKLDAIALQNIQLEIDQGFFDKYTCSGCFWGTRDVEEEDEFTQKQLPRLKKLVKHGHNLFYYADW